MPGLALSVVLNTVAAVQEALAPLEALALREAPAPLAQRVRLFYKFTPIHS